MRRQEQVRAVIVNELIAGTSAKDIIMAHKLTKSTVYYVKNRFEAFLAAGGSPESFSVDRKKHKRRSDCKAAAIAVDVLNMMRRDPGISLRDIAVELKVHERTIRRTIKEEEGTILAKLRNEVYNNKK
jgi:transposase